MKKRQTAGQALAAAAKTFEAKQKEYGDNHVRLGAALAAMFPQGIALKSAKDHERFAIVSLIVVKLTRYAVNFSKGHKDSPHDMTVYSAMLEAIDAEVFGGN